MDVLPTELFLWELRVSFIYKTGKVYIVQCYFCGYVADVIVKHSGSETYVKRWQKRLKFMCIIETNRRHYCCEWIFNLLNAKKFVNSSFIQLTICNEECDPNEVAQIVYRKWHLLSVKYSLPFYFLKIVDDILIHTEELV